MNTVKERKLTSKELMDLAKGKLIEQKKCSKHKDTEHTVICYGHDLNFLDFHRKWIYEEEFQVSGSSLKAKDYANKVVLYVNATELDKMLRHLRAEGL